MCGYQSQPISLKSFPSKSKSLEASPWVMWRYLGLPCRIHIWSYSNQIPLNPDMPDEGLTAGWAAEGRKLWPLLRDSHQNSPLADAPIWGNRWKRQPDDCWGPGKPLLFHPSEPSPLLMGSWNLRETTCSISRCSRTPWGSLLYFGDHWYKLLVFSGGKVFLIVSRHLRRLLTLVLKVHVS